MNRDLITEGIQGPDHLHVLENIRINRLDDGAPLVLDPIIVPEVEHAVLVPEHRTQLGPGDLLDEVPAVFGLHHREMRDPQFPRVQDGGIRRPPVDNLVARVVVIHGVRTHIVVDVLKPEVIPDHDPTPRLRIAAGARRRLNVDVYVAGVDRGAVRAFRPKLRPQAIRREPTNPVDIDANPGLTGGYVDPRGLPDDLSDARCRVALPSPGRPDLTRLNQDPQLDAELDLGVKHNLLGSRLPVRAVAG